MEGTIEGVESEKCAVYESLPIFRSEKIIVKHLLLIPGVIVGGGTEAVTVIGVVAVVTEVVLVVVVLVIVVVLVVLLFGRGKISSLMGDVAKGIKSFKKGMSSDSSDSNDQSKNDQSKSDTDKDSNSQN